jgi:hypothetical protein
VGEGALAPCRRQFDRQKPRRQPGRLEVPLNAVEQVTGQASMRRHVAEI